ncbi:MAG: DEAD/DEAH box helicase [Mycobacteriales bacterium]
MAPRPSPSRRRQDAGPIAVLAMAAADVNRAIAARRVSPATRATFQAVAMLLREQRAAARAAPVSEAERAVQLKRLDGVAVALARTAAGDASLLALLAEDAPLLAGTATARRELRAKAGLPVEAETLPTSGPAAPPARAGRQVVPQSALARSLANPFLVPDYSAAAPARARPRLLADWELLRPLLRAFEQSGADAASCMSLPDPREAHLASGLELMAHQAQVVAKAKDGHRSFLLADEPGLGKTAEALLATQAAGAYPLLAVVPNVVKTNWAREAAMWTPEHAATVIHGDGADVDAFCDIVIVNYDILDRHVGWLANFGFRAMVIDEAHFIKNKSSQRSRHVLELSRRLRERSVRPLLMALTGTPLVNDIEDFLAIWEFLGWISERGVAPELLHALEANARTPLDPGFYPGARKAVIEMGIVRRRKIDVANDIPARRIADLPIELDGELAASVRSAEAKLAARLVKRYHSALAARKDAGQVEGIDLSIARAVCARELREGHEHARTESVFSVMRRIGVAKAELAADYAAQLSRSAGKVVFFAKHIDVMDAAERVFAKRGLGYASIRGEQTARVRQTNIDAFASDEEVRVIVCSLSAAGVGVNLQVSSNVVLAELSWTAAEQTQAIDRVHRIGQDQPVTAWRVIAAQTIDARVAELIGAKEGLAARALDGAEVEAAGVDVRLEALVGLLTDALGTA